MAAAWSGRRRGGSLWRQGAGVARTRSGEIERLARPASAGSADRRIVRNRQLAAPQRARRARGIRILAGIEGIAAAAALRLGQRLAAAPG